jgi:hypothetical protein
VVDCQVVQVKKERHNEYEEEKVGLQVGAVDGKWRRLAKAQRGHFFHAGVNPKKVLMEFKISPDAVVPVGTLPPRQAHPPPIPPHLLLIASRVVVVVVGCVVCQERSCGRSTLCPGSFSTSPARRAHPRSCANRVAPSTLMLNRETGGGGGGAHAGRARGSRV